MPRAKSSTAWAGSAAVTVWWVPAEVLGQRAQQRQPRGVGGAARAGPGDVHAVQLAAGGPSRDPGGPAQQHLALGAAGERDHDALGAHRDHGSIVRSLRDVDVRPEVPRRGSARRSTSRVTGATSPTPKSRKRNRFTAGLPSVHSK